MVVGLVAAGFLPLLYWHFAGLLQRPHYQFLILFPLAIAMVVSTIPADSPRRRTFWGVATAAMMLIIAMAGLGLATWAWSPWLAAVASLFAFAGILLIYGGFSTFLQWLPVWVCCLVLIPIPFGLDEELIVRLRTVTTSMSSALLDQLGVLHQCYANVIQLPQKSLFIADACSGINSLYVLIGLAVFYCMYFRRGVVHTTLLVTSTFGLVLLENVTRIVFVAMALGWNRDFSSGWKHTALGAVLFCISSLLVVSTDQLLSFLLPQELLTRLRDLLIRRKTSDAEPKTAAANTATEGSATSVGGWIAIAAVFPLLGAWQFVRMPADAPSLAAIFPASFDLPEFGKDSLPSSIEGYELMGYEMIRRVDGDPFGKAGQRWTFQKGNIQAGISLDYPYDGTKDLTECYSLVGWEIPAQEVLSSETLKKMGVESGQGAMAVCQLKREFYGTAELVFSTFDTSGTSEALLKDVAKGTATDKVSRRWNFARNDADTEPPVPQTSKHSGPKLQVHLLATGASELTAEERIELLKLFTVCRERIVSKVVAESGQASEEANGKAGQ